MERIRLDSVKECNALLANNTFAANGKNFPVDHLYATSANSRWPYENLWGIYLAKSDFAWMALWMAVTLRAKMKKRQIAYFCPDKSKRDYIGSIKVFNPERLSAGDILCKTAYLYLFNPGRFRDFLQISVADQKNGNAKMEILAIHDFAWQDIMKRGKNYHTCLDAFGRKSLIDLDEWQMALVGVETIVPDIEIVIGESLIEELAVRVGWSDEEVGNDYLIK
jgi:hypothetical protein